MKFGMGKGRNSIIISVIIAAFVIGMIVLPTADAVNPKQIEVVGAKNKDLEKELLLDQCTFTLLSPAGESTIIQDAQKKNKVSLEIPDDAEITAAQCLFVDGSIGDEFTLELEEDGKTKVTVIHPRTIAIDSFFDVVLETETTSDSFFDVFFDLGSFFDVFFEVETPRDSTCPVGEELKLNEDSTAWECATADTIDSFFDVFFDIVLGTDTNTQGLADLKEWHEMQDARIDALEERIVVLEAGLPPPPPIECDVFDTRALTANFVSAVQGPDEVTYTLTNNFDCELTFAQGFKSKLNRSGASNSFEVMELTLGPFEAIEIVKVVPNQHVDTTWTIFNDVSETDPTPVGNCAVFGTPDTCPVSGQFFFR